MVHFLNLLEEIYEEENLINEADSEFVLECICTSKQVCSHACITGNKIHRLLLLMEQCES